MIQDILVEFTETFDDVICDDFSLAISKAFMANHLAFKDDSTLSCETALDYKPHNLRTRVDHFLDQIKNHNPKVSSSVKWNIRKSCRYLELCIGNFIVTQNWVKELLQSPRPAKFRDQLQDQNAQLYFAFMKDILQIVKSNDDLTYVQLIYGGYGDKPNFINLAIPDGFGNWICGIEIPVITLADRDVEKIEDARHLSTKQLEKTEEDNAK